MMAKPVFSVANTLKVFALGVQRTGTTSLGAALTKAGYLTAHNRPKWVNRYTSHTGVYIMDAFRDGVDPISYIPGCEAIVHPSVCILHPEPVNLWPQLELPVLDAIRHHHPDCLFLLNTRPVNNWIRSLTNWKDLRQRMTDAEIPYLPAGIGGKDEELRDWIEGHWQRMREFFKDDRFIEINVENGPDCGAVLSALLGREIRWPWLNRGK